MRVFIYVMFFGSAFGVLAGIAAMASVKEWPHTIRWARWEYATKIIVAIGFMFWEAYLLWGKP